MVQADEAPGRRSPVPAILALSSAMVVVAAALMLLVVPQLPVPDTARHVPWWVLAPLFTVCERLAVDLRVGRSAFRVSFSHVPLVLGLCFLQPMEFVLASLLGSALTQLVFRRQSGLKLFFNTALWGLEAALASTCYGLLTAGADPASLRGLAGAVVTIIVIDQVTALAVTAVISLHEGAFDRESMRESLTWGLLMAVCNTCGALLIVVLLEREPAAIALLVVVLGVLVLSYRAYEQLHRAHARLERHHGVAESLARAQGSEAVVGAVLEQAREMLQAERAELHLDGLVHSGAGADAPAGPTTEFWVRRTASSERSSAALLARGTKDPGERAVLDATGAQEAAAAPVSTGGASGVLVVTDRLGEVAGFEPGDLRALETLAHQASVALENGRLVDRLRQEATDRAHEALHDALTGLPNRRSLREALDAALERGAAAGVVLLDLDRFKEVNDALGHTVGDGVLLVVAARLRQALPDDALVARLGGDEFAVLVPDASSPEVVLDTVVAVQRALAEPVAVPSTDGVEVDLEASIGSATAPLDGSDSAGLLQRADVAMYRAKAERTGYEAYVAALDRSSAERLALCAELRRTVTAEQLDVFFQPSVDPASGRVVGAEALVRWHHPVRGMVSPEEFIPLAERSGLIGQLTLQVLRRSLAELARLRSAGLLPSVAVNLSPRVLLDVDLPRQVETMLAAAGLPPHVLTLEVTEGAVMADPERALAVLEGLHRVGVHLSVDDFGTGYSSLSYLKRLPVQEVKIDRSFITRLAEDPADAAIVRSTIELAHALGLTVVAEGVEDEATLALLGTWGCEAAQGFHMCRPLPVGRLDAWLAEHESVGSATRGGAAP